MKLKLFSQYRGLRKELYILFIGRIMTNMGSMVWPILTLILNERLGLDATTIAIAMAIFTVLSFPLVILGGKLADKYNKRNIIVIFDLISVIGFVYCYFVPVSITSIIVYAISSLFQTAEYPAYESLIADFTTAKDRSRAYSLGYLGSNLGLVLSPTIAGILFNYNLNLVFLISGLSILLSTILIFFLIKNVTKVEDNTKESYYEHTDSNVKPLKFIFTNRIILLFFLFKCISESVYSMYNFLMPLDLAVLHGENGSVIFGTVSSLNCLVVVLFTSIITKIFAKKSDLFKTFLGQALMIGAYVLFLGTSNLVFMCYVIMVVFTWGEILNTISNSPYITKRIPASYRGRIMSFINLIPTVFCSLFKILIGFIYDNVSGIIAWITVILFGLLQLGLIVLMMKLDKIDYPVLYETNEDRKGE